MKPAAKRIKISHIAYEKVIRNNLTGDELHYKRIAGKKRGTFCYAYFRERSEDGGPVALWESTGHVWVWRTWKRTTFFKKLLTKVLA